MDYDFQNIVDDILNRPRTYKSMRNKKQLGSKLSLNVLKFKFKLKDSVR